MFKHELILNHIDDIFGQDMHAKRVLSLANATLGVIESGSLAIHAIGSGLSLANGLERKHAVKQVDRLLTNTKLNVWSLFDDWVPYVVGERTEIVVSMDWTEFDADDHSTLVISLQTNHGRSTPLLWKTHRKSLLKGQRNAHEKELLTKLKQTLPEGIFVTVVADRGFGYMELFERLEQELGFAYVIRFKGNILVGYPGGEQVPARDWLTPTGRTRTLKQVELTGQRQPVERVYCCRKSGMKDAWFLASNRTDLSAANVAQKVGLPPGQVFKTLVARGDKTGVIMGIVSGEAEIDLKALASASGNKKVEMVHLNEVLPLTGYIRGGVSPLGAKKNYPVYLDRSALTPSIISISAGLRGMQIFLRPDDLVKATNAAVCDIGRVVGEIGEGNE